MQQGDASRAAELFKRPDWKGAAHYRAGEYEQAVQSLDGLDSAQTLYNKGNALARLGRYPEAIEAYEEAIQLDPAHEDARYNRDLVERQLQEKQQQAGQQGQEGQPQQGQQNQSPQQAGQDQGMEQQSQGGVENETDSRDQDNPDDAAASAQSPNKKRMPESMKSPADTHNRTTHRQPSPQHKIKLPMSPNKPPSSGYAEYLTIPGGYCGENSIISINANPRQAEMKPNHRSPIDSH